jgi:hypothetical protein
MMDLGEQGLACDVRVPGDPSAMLAAALHALEAYPAPVALPLVSEGGSPLLPTLPLVPSLRVAADIYACYFHRSEGGRALMPAFVEAACRALGRGRMLLSEILVAVADGRPPPSGADPLRRREVVAVVDDLSTLAGVFVDAPPPAPSAAGLYEAVCELISALIGLRGAPPPAAV